MKPDWSSAPEWASYAAQELSGSYLWHELRPRFLEVTGEWRSSGRWAVVPKVTTRPQETLEARPASSLEDMALRFCAEQNDPAYWQDMLGLKPFLRGKNVQQE